MSARVVCAVALVLAATAPLSAHAQSLWREGAPGANLFADHRARSVNDLVTILIVEESSSARTGNTKTSKEDTRTVAINRAPTAFDPLARQLKPLTDPMLKGGRRFSEWLGGFGLDLAGAASHEGKGTIERSDRVSAQMAARVVKVVDGGNLMIEGRRAVLVNDETQVITLSGVIRPEDISGTNTVLSSQIADAEIQMVGKGLIADTQRPGIFFRILDWLRLF